MVSHEAPGSGMLTVIHAADPEGSILELQSWR
jgi:hypothetical protein